MHDCMLQSFKRKGVSQYSMCHTVCMLLSIPARVSCSSSYILQCSCWTHQLWRLSGVAGRAYNGLVNLVGVSAISRPATFQISYMVVQKPPHPEYQQNNGFMILQ